MINIIAIFVMLNTYMINSNLFNESPKVNVISPKSVGIKPFTVGGNLFNMEEIWKIIDGYNNAYQISNLGNVRSIHKSKKILKTDKDDPDRYVSVTLYLSVGKRKKEKIHRLIAKAFIPNPENKSQVNHINGNKKDNSIENLEWVTPSENVIHSYKTGLQKPTRGTDSCRAKLTEENIINIRKEWDDEKQLPYLSNKYGVAKTTIHAIVKRYTWKHI